MDIRVIVFIINIFLLTINGHSLISNDADGLFRTKRQGIPEGATCILPSHPAGGHWSLINNEQYNPGQNVAANTILKYECNTGYTLSEKDAVLTCSKSGWSQDPPLCLKFCPILYSDEGTKISCYDNNKEEIKCSEATDGSYANYECAIYYETADYNTSNRRYCVNGQWNPAPLQCVPECGLKQIRALPLIVNAKPAKIGNYPWVTAIFFKDDETSEFINICGVAHCLTDHNDEAKSPDSFKIAVGKYFNKYGDPRDTKAQYSDIEKVLIHERYKGETLRYSSDIAFLITKNKLALSNVVQPICYKNLFTITLTDNDLGIIAGWGYTSPDDNPAEELQEVIIPYKSDETCARESPTEWFDKYLTYDKFCAGHYNKSIAICNGDNGNGLVFKNKDGRYYIHGIASLGRQFDEGCDIQSNALYTKVETHYEWLQQIAQNYF